MRSDDDPETWPLILRTGFGNVFAVGRWDHHGTVLIAGAYNSDDWAEVEAYAREMPWVSWLAS